MKLWRRLVAFFRRGKLDAEMTEEMRLHLEQRIREHIAAGFSPEDARYAALRKFGGVEQIKEIAREQRAWRWLDELAQGVRYAIRSLTRNPGFSATIVLTLALGLGANVAIFTIFRGVLIKPLSFPESDRLVITRNQYPRTNFGRVASSASVPNYFERKQGIAAFSDVAALRFASAIVGTGRAPDQVGAGYVTPSFFDVLGIKPASGRFFSPAETDSATNSAVVLSDSFWRQHFNADPSAIGRELRVNGIVATIIGITPREFRYPSREAQVWLPLNFTANERSAGSRHSTTVDVIARLGPDASIANAQSQLDALNAQLAPDDPKKSWAAEAGFRAVVVTLQADCAAPVKPALVLLQAGACFLLLIGGVNLVNLLLARAAARAREFTVRRALGASRGRVAAHLLFETFALTFSGGLLGLGCGAAALRGLSVFGGDRLPLIDNVTFDWPIAIAAMGGSLAAGLVAALPVIAGASRLSLPSTLNAAARSGTASRSIRRLRHGLMVVQVALAFVLLAITSLLGVSLRRVLAVQPGFQPDHILTGVFHLPSARYETPSMRLALTERLLAEVRAQPGVITAGISTSLPFGSIGGSAFLVEGNSAAGAEAATHYMSLLGGDFFETLGVPLREGRYFTAADSHRAERGCVIDEAFAQTYWPGRSPLGYRVFEGTTRDPTDPGATIVGVVGTVREGDPGVRPTKGKVYFPFAEDWTPSFLYLAIKTGPLPDAMTSAVRTVLAKIDPELVWFDVQTLPARLDESLIARRTPLRVAGAFAGIALILAVVGVYGMVAYEVAQRRREIGIRMALGAGPGQILTLFLSLGSRVWLAGLLAGFAATLGIRRVMESLLYGVSPGSLEVLMTTGFLLGATVFLASALPSLRASRISPSVALRCE